MQRRGAVNLPLHGGHPPSWLFTRMVDLSGALASVIIEEYSINEFLNRISNPYWFQAFSCVLGFDWHSSGTTTTTLGALKASLDPEEHGIYLTGGISAKIDNSCIQDGYTLYQHNFFITEKGDWAVVQQGLNTQNKYARRYHWLGSEVDDLLNDPHSGISCDQMTPQTLNMPSEDSKEAQKISVDLINDNPNHLRQYFKRKDNQLLLEDFTMPAHHPVLDMDISDKEFEILTKAWEIQPENYEELILLQGIGPKKIRALALISDLVYGEPASWKDPVKYSFTIETIRDALDQARIKKEEKLKAIKRLDDFIS